jgi:hypothetical protein
MNLNSVQRGKIAQPHRVVLYGPDGVGKTTFGASAPSPVFLGAEKGTAQLDVARFPQPQEWSDVQDAIKALAFGDAHEFKTLIVDTLDWLEPILHAKIAKAASVQSVDDIPYGAGFNQALDFWRQLLAQLEYLSEKRGMNIVLLAHSQTRTFKNPLGADFDRYELKLHHKASGLVREWADAVLFATYEEFAVEKKGRVRGVDSGARIIFSTRTAAFDAKNRLSLPSPMPLDWDDFDAACKASRPADPSALRASIESLLEGAAPELAATVRATVAKAGDNANGLAKIHNRLIAITSPTKNEEASK